MLYARHRVLCRRLKVPEEDGIEEIRIGIALFINEQVRCLVCSRGSIYKVSFDIDI